MKRVFVNGCFDLLHVGHVRMLHYAASLGELTVAINSDRSVRLLKGEGRPIFPAFERAEILGAIKYVSQVMIFDEPTPEKLLRNLYHAKDGPHYVVKGSDYKYVKIPERELIESNGGTIMLFRLVEKKSTTAAAKMIFKLNPRPWVKEEDR